MDFRLDQEQIELRATVRRLCADRFGYDDLARRESRSVDRAGWRALADLGVFAALLPECGGGAGAGVVGGAIVFEQLGAHLVGGPLVWTTLAARWFEDSSRGERMVGGVELCSMTQAPVLVEHAESIDALLVLRDDGVFVCAGDDLPAFEAVAPLDPLTPIGRAAALPDGIQVGDARAATAARLSGSVLTAAMMVGIADVALEASRRWALEREQFGVAIGSFQAVQHVLADMYVRTALARSATYAAAATLDDPAIGDPARASAAAKLLAGEAALENARAAIQVHGGMGFTWEMPPHYLLKRAWVLEYAFGDTDVHALTLGAAIEERLA